MLALCIALAFGGGGPIAIVSAQSVRQAPVWHPERVPMTVAGSSDFPESRGVVQASFETESTSSSVIEVAPSQLPLNQALETPTVPAGVVPLGPVVESADASGEVVVEGDPELMSPIVVAPEVYLDTEDPYENTSAFLRNFSLMAGVHGFRGPSDFVGTGNFGFNEGINWGFPLLPFLNLAGQAGVMGVHSNFSGTDYRFDMEGFHSGRDQIFATGGVFTRAVDGGWQSGSAFDYFHDSAFSNTDLTQARVELAYNFRGRCEFGFWGAYGANSDTVTFTILQRFITKLEPTDLYTLFYRHHFTGGGQGRIWAGLTGDGAAVFGGEATVPLGTNWAIQNNFTYRVADPDQPPEVDDESWAVSIRLVWYPWKLSRNAFRDPQQPLFNVADNSVFLIDRGMPTPAP
jgi:hypothetical protein